MTLAKARIVNYDRNSSFIVLATVIMIVNHDHHLFIVQAPGVFAHWQAFPAWCNLTLGPFVSYKENEML